MVDPARLVPIDAGVDDVSVIEGKEEGMMRIMWVTRRIVLRLLPGTTFSFVLDNPGPLANRRRRENAAPVNARFPNDYAAGGFLRAVAI